MHRATSLKPVQGEDNSARQPTSRPVSGVFEVDPKRAPTLAETAADAAWAPIDLSDEARASGATRMGRSAPRRCDWG